MSQGIRSLVNDIKKDLLCDGNHQVLKHPSFRLLIAILSELETNPRAMVDPRLVVDLISRCESTGRFIMKEEAACKLAKILTSPEISMESSRNR